MLFRRPSKYSYVFQRFFDVESTLGYWLCTWYRPIDLHNKVNTLISTKNTMSSFKDRDYVILNSQYSAIECLLRVPHLSVYGLYPDNILHWMFYAFIFETTKDSSSLPPIPYWNLSSYLNFIWLFQDDLLTPKKSHKIGFFFNKKQTYASCTHLPNRVSALLSNLTNSSSHIISFSIFYFIPQQFPFVYLAKFSLYFKKIISKPLYWEISIYTVQTYTYW